MAKIYAVGVGPGDPELLTRKAERIIRQAPVICTPTGQADAASYALSIVEESARPLPPGDDRPALPDDERQGRRCDGFWEEAATEVTAADRRRARTSPSSPSAIPVSTPPSSTSTGSSASKAPTSRSRSSPASPASTRAAAAAGIPLGMAVRADRHPPRHLRG